MAHKLKTIAAAVFMLGTLQQVAAQKSEIPVKEFAVRLNSLSYIDFVFKNEKKVDRIRRFRVMASSLALTSGQKNTSLLANVGLAYGLEKRKDLGVNTYFIHGWEPYLLTSLTQGNKYLVGQVTLGVGYIVGFAHNFSNGFAMGIETTPSLSSNRSVDIKNNSPQPFKLNANFSVSNIAISFVYRMQ